MRPRRWAPVGGTQMHARELEAAACYRHIFRLAMAVACRPASAAALRFFIMPNGEVQRKIDIACVMGPGAIRACCASGSHPPNVGG